MSERTCGNCRWYEVYADSDKTQGHCTRHAPRPMVNLDGEPYAAWPVTQQMEFCGEWADKSITPEQEERRELVRRFAVAIVAGDGEIRSADDVWKVATMLADADLK